MIFKSKEEKAYRAAILAEGQRLLDVVHAWPERYIACLGSYLHNRTLFGALIRFQQRGEASHSSVVILEKATMLPTLEFHALEGWGLIATEPGVLGREGAILEIRAVDDAPPVAEVLIGTLPILGAAYEKPLGFVTKSRRTNPFKWFCSEYANMIFELQNCFDFLVSPPWARRSSKAKNVVLQMLCNGREPATSNQQPKTRSLATP